jgi:PAS domain-containing protein
MAAVDTVPAADDLRIMEMDTPKLNFEEPIPQPDGSQVWVRTNKAPLHGRDGKIIGILRSSEDITVWKLSGDSNGGFKSTHWGMAY